MGWIGEEIEELDVVVKPEIPAPEPGVSVPELVPGRETVPEPVGVP